MMGHGQKLVIGDAGLPVPEGVPCIDLAVTLGVPGFWEVLDAVLEELMVEHAVIASEASDKVRAQFEERVTAELCSHEALKELSASAVAIVRTGEGTPYTNIVLFAGVSF